MLLERADEGALWDRYRDSGDGSAKDELYRIYSPWARNIAYSVQSRLRVYPVDRDDFVQNASIGLIESMSRYDPKRGVSFQAYAKPRIRGAVFNGIRSIIEDRVHSQNRASNPLAREAAHELGDDIDALSGFVDSVVGIALNFLLEDAAELSALDVPLEYASSQQFSTRLMHAIGRLPARHQNVIRRHYFGHEPFHAIAADLGVTKGRISQIHHASLALLRETLKR